MRAARPGTKSRAPVPKHGTCSLQGAPEAEQRGGVSRALHCRHLIRRGGRRGGHPQVAVRVRNPHRVGDVRVATGANHGRDPDAAAEDRGGRMGNDTMGQRVRSRRPCARGESAGASPRAQVPSTRPPFSRPSSASARRGKSRPRAVTPSPQALWTAAVPRTASSGPAGLAGSSSIGEKDGSPSPAPGAPPRNRPSAAPYRAPPSPTPLGTGKASAAASPPGGASTPEGDGRASVSNLTRSAPSRWAASPSPGSPSTTPSPSWKPCCVADEAPPPAHTAPSGNKRTRSSCAPVAKQPIGVSPCS